MLADRETRDRYALTVVEVSFRFDVNREAVALFVSMKLLQCYMSSLREG